MSVSEPVVFVGHLWGGVMTKAGNGNVNVRTRCQYTGMEEHRTRS
jgi:hypothetical protein